MDGLSIVTAAISVAGHAWTVGTEIYQFIKHTSNVNESVRSLANEVKALGDICTSISEQTESISSLDTAKLQTGIKSQLLECEQTIAKLDRALHGVRRDYTNLAKQAVSALFVHPPQQSRLTVPRSANSSWICSRMKLTSIEGVSKLARRAGEEAFSSRKYQEAYLMLQEGLLRLRSLPGHLRHNHDLEELHLRMAVCTFHQHDLPSAEVALITLVERESISTADALRKLEAGILLAQVYLRLGKLDLARSTAENVYRGRRKLLKKDSEACYESLGFLVKAYTLLQKPSRAIAYRAMLPTEHREHYCQLFDRLGVEQQQPVLQSHMDERQGSDNQSQTTAVEATCQLDTISPNTPTTFGSEHSGITWSAASKSVVLEGDTASFLDEIPTFEAIALSWDGTIIAITGFEVGKHFIGVLRTDQRDHGRWRIKFQTHNSPSLLAISPDKSKCAASEAKSESTDIWSLQTGQLLRQLSWKARWQDVQSLNFAITGSWLVSRHNRGRLRLWDSDTGKKKRHQYGHHSALSVREQSAYSNHRHLTWIDLGQDKVCWSRVQSSAIAGLTFSEDGSVLAVAYTDEYLALYRHNPPTGHFSSRAPFAVHRAEPRLESTLDSWGVKILGTTFVLGTPKLAVIVAQFGPKVLAAYNVGYKKWWKISTGNAALTHHPWHIQVYNGKFTYELDDGTRCLIDQELRYIACSIETRFMQP